MSPRSRPRRGPAPAATTAPSPKRAAILDAATRLFVRHGYRRTSMELLAAEARVAKPTLYAHFDDKDAVFRAVVDAVMTGIVDGARAAAARSGPVGERLAGVLVAKFTFLHELLHASPHAAELLDSQGQLGADIVARHDAELRRLLATLVTEGVASRELDLERAQVSVSALVEDLLRLGHGADFGDPTVAAHRRHLTELVRLVVTGVGRR